MSKDVTNVERCEGTRLILTFQGGERRSIDIAAAVLFDGVFADLRQPEFFRQVRVNAETGTIEWPNGADLCPDALYQASVRVDSPRAA